MTTDESEDEWYAWLSAIAFVIVVSLLVYSVSRVDGSVMARTWWAS